MYIKVFYNIKYSRNNKTGGIRCRRLDLTQNHHKLEKKTKKKKKVEQKLCLERD